MGTDMTTVESQEPESQGPKGIGGWLILVVIGLILTPLMVGRELLTIHLPIFTDGTWHLLTTPGTEVYHPLWAPLIIFETVGNIALIVLAIVTLVSLLNKSSRTPMLATIYFGWNLFFIAADMILADGIPSIEGASNIESYKDLARAVVAAAIWIPYFHLSKRVKATFVE